MKAFNLLAVTLAVIFHATGYAQASDFPPGDICAHEGSQGKVTFRPVNCDGKMLGAYTGPEEQASRNAGLNVQLYVKIRADEICQRAGFARALSYFLIAGNKKPRSPLINHDYPYALYADEFGSYQLIRSFLRVPEGIEWGTGYTIPQQDFEGKLFDSLTCITE